MEGKPPCACGKRKRGRMHSRNGGGNGGQNEVVTCKRGGGGREAKSVIKQAPDGQRANVINQSNKESQPCSGRES